jgi:hypothetical protein
MNRGRMDMLQVDAGVRRLTKQKLGVFQRCLYRQNQAKWDRGDNKYTYEAQRLAWRLTDARALPL